MGIRVQHKGSYKRTHSYLTRIIGSKYTSILERYGEIGVKALAEATPKRTGETASKWSYLISETSNGISLTFINTSVGTDGQFSIVIGLDRGHGTVNGSYVKGLNFIKPTINPIMDELAAAVWKEVRK